MKMTKEQYRIVKRFERYHKIKRRWWQWVAVEPEVLEMMKEPERVIKVPKCSH